MSTAAPTSSPDYRRLSISSEGDMTSIAVINAGSSSIKLAVYDRAMHPALPLRPSEDYAVNCCLVAKGEINGIVHQPTDDAPRRNEARRTVKPAVINVKSVRSIPPRGSTRSAARQSVRHANGRHGFHNEPLRSGELHRPCRSANARIKSLSGWFSWIALPISNAFKIGYRRSHQKRKVLILNSVGSCFEQLGRGRWM